MKLKFIITILIIILMLSSSIYASTISAILGEAEKAMQDGKGNSSGTFDTDKIKKMSDIIYNVFLAVGTAIAVIVGAILGIQFMTAGIDSKVKAKESLVVYVISCIVLFGAFGIWKLIVTILSGI